MSWSILVVDDSATARSQLRLAFEAKGVKVIEAENGREGLWRARAENVDLIFSDIHMPVMDGLQMIQVATAIKSSALEVLATLGEFRVDAGEFLVPNQTALSDLSAIIAFSGEASGHLMLSMTSEDARTLYLRFVPGARAVPVDRLEDLVGELCNRILGRINAFFAQHAMATQQTTPLFIRAAGAAPCAIRAVTRLSAHS